MRTRTKQVLVFAAILGTIVAVLTLLWAFPWILLRILIVVPMLALLAVTIFLLWMIWDTAGEIVERFGRGGGDA